ncbi:DEAD/DEAH box helicase family protein [uncultured Algimonas sp.]|uniref:DEAD/DEAH box helicase n=1 Tax=uncultured Algimonas sp. TaxID=1547920 RepID=UPI00261991D4|nr:DEAD/DEAH box helicase family protein [uncultured Algimonas sp.]
MRKPHIDEAKIKRGIGQRLSLRTPQEESLDILADVLGLMDFDQTTDVKNLLAEIAAKYPTVESFERQFPSLCFALATGVGKTRLMGAMITYLFQTGRSRNFFVLAPNTTIYEKLIDDFSVQSSPKYVFRGIREFAQKPPVIVTGDTWEQGRGVRGSDLFDDTIINIFNVDKINKDAGRIKGFKETIGDSYFDYLAGLDDLVMFMDEAHRYRAKAATKAIFELSPKLGIELTATPKTVGAKPKDFKNVIYFYGLGNAMADSYVKEPAVLTRADFRKDGLDQDQLEQIMLEDGIHYHNHVDAELDLYARQTGRKRVHPFMLVVAQNTEHAAAIRAKIESDSFFNGAFIGRVAEVHSKLKGDESNEAMDRLVGLETTNDTDIVIHVNKLKEGWDVTNLYTIVPLRASASEILTEQTLGRGLRLPYGERTGNPDVDRLTVIAHDKFQDIVDRAKADDSVVKLKTLTIGEGGDISDDTKVIVESVPAYIAAMTGAATVESQIGLEVNDAQSQSEITYNTPIEQETAKDILNVLNAMGHVVSGANELSTADRQKEIVKRVSMMQERQQGALEGIVDAPDLERMVAQVTKVFTENLIEIPDIVVLPSNEVNFWFEDFDLDTSNQSRFQPISERLIIQQLRDEIRTELARTLDAPKEERVENYIVKHLMDYPDIDYDSQAELLYKLAGQSVAFIQSYAEGDEAVENIALSHGRQLAEFIYRQMKKHYRQTPAEYIPKVTRSYRAFTGRQFSFSPTKQLFLNQAAKPLSATKNFVFKGGNKSPDHFHKFDSDPERRFAVLIDSDFESDVLWWLKPAPKQFRIEYDTNKPYEPDFVVETTDLKLVVEVKADRDMQDPVVLEKKRAAETWVFHANQFETGGKTWKYLLVSESDINASATLEGVIAKCG